MRTRRDPSCGPSIAIDTGTSRYMLDHGHPFERQPQDLQSAQAQSPSKTQRPSDMLQQQHSIGSANYSDMKPLSTDSKNSKETSEDTKTPQTIIHVLFGIGKIGTRHLPANDEYLKDTAKSSDSSGQSIIPLRTSSNLCQHNLAPAFIPHNPINGKWRQSTPIERELAWLVEESAIILQQLAEP